MNSESSVNSEESEVKLSSKGTKYFSADVDLGKLKTEFTNLNARFKNRKKITVFTDALEFFDDVVKCEFKWELFSSNTVKLLRLAMIHPATTATCERSFILAKLIKTDI